MWRALTEPVALFLAPFVLYVLYLLVIRRHPLKSAHWPSQTLFSLTLAGLAIAVAGMLLFGLTASRNQGGYVPAHVENGKVVPGRFE
jgi:hypothetical protein